MVAGCGNKTVKFLVFIFNFLIFVAGAVVLGVSLWAALDPNFINKLPDAFEKALTQEQFDIKSYRTAFFVLAGIGGFLILVGFLGCCGAACENRLLLGLFFVIVLILTVAQVAAAIAALVMKGKFYTYLQDRLEDVWKDGSTEGKKAMRPIEDAFNCCGIKNSDTDTYCTQKNYTQGCLNVIWGEIKKNMIAAAAIGIAVVVIEILAMIFSCILCGAYSRRDGYYA